MWKFETIQNIEQQCLNVFNLEISCWFVGAFGSKLCLYRRYNTLGILSTSTSHTFTKTIENIATGETSQVITSRHFSSLLFTSMSNLTSLALKILSTPFKEKLITLCFLCTDPHLSLSFIFSLFALWNQDHLHTEQKTTGQS